MLRECVNSGGVASLVRLDGTLVSEQEVPFGPQAAAALCCWQVRPGAIVTVVDAVQQCWRARLTSLHDQGGTLVPFSKYLNQQESPLRLEIGQAIPARERFELVLEKLTELGVSRIVPFVSARSSTVAERDARQRKSHRWPEVVRRAAIQSRRAMIPELAPACPLSKVLADLSNCEVKLVCYEGEGTWTLREALRNSRPHSLALLIGPEGGFTSVEIDQSRSAGFLPVSLGPRLLRTETAAIVSAAVLQFALGDLG